MTDVYTQLQIIISPPTMLRAFVIVGFRGKSTKQNARNTNMGLVYGFC